MKQANVFIRKQLQIGVSTAVLALLAAGLEIGLTATGAQAGGFGRDRGGSIKDAPDVAVAMPFRWTGFYLGAHVGYGWGDSKTTNLPDAGYGRGFNDGKYPTSISSDPHGGIAGVQLGYNWQRGSVVYGIEADLGHLGVDKDVFIVQEPDNFISTSYGFYGTLTGRLGLAANRTLFYVKGGFAWADIEHRAGDLYDGRPDASDTTRRDKTEAGWTIGGGIEHALGSNWTLKGEYLFMDFGDYKSTNADGDIFKTEHQLHTVKAGLNFRF